MKSHITLTLCLIAAVGSCTASAQNIATQPNESNHDATVGAPVAYIYVASNNSATSNQIVAFAADRKGRLTPIAGSPFAGEVWGMAVNGKYLFGIDTNGMDIDSFSIGWNGALKQVATINAQYFNTSGCQGQGQIVLDHTGANLYESVLAGGLCDSTVYQSFTVEKPTGKLKYLGSSTESFLYNTPLSFIGDNIFAYGSECIDYQGGYLDTFSGYRRQSDGMLNYAAVSTPEPATPDAKSFGSFYCASLTAADRTNHLAVSLQRINLTSESPEGPTVLATYTADKYGNLNTTSTYENMPATEVGDVSDMDMAPSGELLAVGGGGGLQVFHFNEDDPITHYTGLLTKDPINQVVSSQGLLYWDNDNHLYALSPAAGKLFVFTITAKGYSQAPGSPYTIKNPQTMIVQPKTSESAPPPSRDTY